LRRCLHSSKRKADRCFTRLDSPSPNTFSPTDTDPPPGYSCRICPASSRTTFRRREELERHLETVGRRCSKCPGRSLEHKARQSVPALTRYVCLLCKIRRPRRAPPAPASSRCTTCVAPRDSTLRLNPCKRCTGTRSTELQLPAEGRRVVTHVLCRRGESLCTASYSAYLHRSMCSSHAPTEREQGITAGP
jgi:hypothetical protein